MNLICTYITDFMYFQIICTPFVMILELLFILYILSFKVFLIVLRLPRLNLKVLTRWALEIAENYCPLHEKRDKIFFLSFKKTKIPFYRIFHDAFFNLIHFLCNLNRVFLLKLKTLNFSSSKIIENQCFSKHEYLLLSQFLTKYFVFPSLDVKYFSGANEPKVPESDFSLL